jgi:hypothetical protein
MYRQILIFWIQKKTDLGWHSKLINPIKTHVSGFAIFFGMMIQIAEWWISIWVMPGESCSVWWLQFGGNDEWWRRFGGLFLMLWRPGRPTSAWGVAVVKKWHRSAWCKCMLYIWIIMASWITLHFSFWYHLISFDQHMSRVRVVSYGCLV